jgi:hypothetical protein
MRTFLALPLERVSGQCHAPALEPGGGGGGIKRCLQVEDWAGTVAGRGAWKDIYTVGSRFTTESRS